MTAPAALEAIAHRTGAGAIELRAPAVGLWRGAPEHGTLVRPGGAVGELEVLGRLVALRAPADAYGIVMSRAEARARRPVGYGDVLVVLDANIGGAASDEIERAAEQVAAATGGLVLRAPSSGRFYRKPGPNKPNFVSEGDEIAVGHTVCLLEVMKTFNRVVYGGDGLPERARVKRIVPADESDLSQGDPILELEAL